MDRETRDEQTWLRRGIGVLTIMAGVMLILLVWALLQQAESRRLQAARTEEILAEVHTIARTLDRQAENVSNQADILVDIGSRLDRQAEALSRQTDLLERRAEEARRSRAQFRDAAQRILELLGSEVDAFSEAAEDAESTSNTTTSETTEITPHQEPEPSPPPPEPKPEPEPTMNNGRPCPSNGGPKECR